MPPKHMLAQEKEAKAFHLRDEPKMPQVVEVLGSSVDTAINADDRADSIENHCT
jgi:hypothetical protein